VAEEKAAAAPEVAQAASAGGSGKQNIILVAIAVVNMLIVAGVGFMLFQNKKKDAAEPKIEHVIKGEHEAQDKEKHEDKMFFAKTIPLETFIVNLAGSKGRRVAKINIEISVEGEGIATEIDQRKAQVRDIIIILLSGQTYDQVSNKEGKDHLKEQIKDTVNAFLTKGKIKEVFFTEFIYN